MSGIGFLPVGELLKVNKALVATLHAAGGVKMCGAKGAIPIGSVSYENKSIWIRIQIKEGKIRRGRVVLNAGQPAVSLQ